MTYRDRVKTSIIYLGVICVGVAGLYFLTSATLAVLRYAEVNQDAGTYLSVIARINEGYLLYRDITSAYPPLVFYITSFLSKSVAHPDYSFYLSVAWCHVILCGLVMALVVQHETSNLFLSISVATLIPLIALQYEGHYFFLEPFVALFAISSFALAVGKDNRLVVFVFAGCAAGLAFMCKQYGLGILPSVCLLGWTSGKNRRYQIVGSILFGFVLAVSLTVGYVLVASKLSLPEFVSFIMPPYASLITPLPIDFWLSMAFIAPFLAIGILLLFDGSLRNNRVFVGVIVAVLGFAPQLLFRQYRHYFLLMIPFMIALWALVFAFILNREYANPLLRRGLRLCVIVLSVALVAYSFNFAFSLTQKLYATNPRAAQIETSTHINKFVPPGSRVILLLNPAFNFLCNFLPARDHPSYGFLQNFSGAKIADRMSKAEYVILSPSDRFYFGDPVHILEESGIQLFAFLDRAGFKLVKIVDVDIQIWQKQLSRK